jgi:hypothetical protein
VQDVAVTVTSLDDLLPVIGLAGAVIFHLPDGGLDCSSKMGTRAFDGSRADPSRAVGKILTSDNGAEVRSISSPTATAGHIERSERPEPAMFSPAGQEEDNL